MDINGVWALVNFPSQIIGFCGRVFFSAADCQLGAACIQAWNDWLYAEWYQAHPSRIVPLGIAYLADPDVAVAEIWRDASRGFTSVTLPERPHEVGLPLLWCREHWDPILQACVDTDTVVLLHVGSSGMQLPPEGAPLLQIGSTLFGQLSLGACVEWLWSGYPLKYPGLKIGMSEGASDGLRCFWTGSTTSLTSPDTVSARPIDPPTSSVRISRFAPLAIPRQSTPDIALELTT
jgi:hypothetical protein